MPLPTLLLTLLLTPPMVLPTLPSLLRLTRQLVRLGS
jgi:hypothetical protein